MSKIVFKRKSVVCKSKEKGAEWFKKMSDLHHRPFGEDKLFNICDTCQNSFIRRESNQMLAMFCKLKNIQVSSCNTCNDFMRDPVI
jgi:hypothetical protein